MTTTNVATADLEGKRIRLKPEHKDPRIFTCVGGFGCNPHAAGTKIFVQDEQGNDVGFVRRPMILEIVE